MPAQAAGRLDPESLVARIIAELQANPAAQQLLLRAMLTNEFLGMPVRLDAIEREVTEIKRRVTRLESDVTEIKDRVTRLESDVAEIKRRVTRLESDVAEIKRRVTRLESDVAEIRIDVAALKGDSLEVRMHKWIRPFLSQKLGLRRARIVLGAVTDTDHELQEAVYDAVDADRITVKQEARVFATDLILRAQRGSDRTTVWVAVEASNTIDERDVERAQESATLLAAIFDEQSTAAVMGHAIAAGPRQLAEARGVEIFLREPNH